MSDKAYGVVMSTKLGPWTIPVGIQTLVINSYALRNGLRLQGIHSEFISWDLYPNFPHEVSVANVVFCSIWAINLEGHGLKTFSELFHEYNLRFALEDIIITREVEVGKFLSSLAFALNERSLYGAYD